MIGPVGRFSPEQRAELIYAQARSDLSTRLWQAALGNSQDFAKSTPLAGRLPSNGGVGSLLSLLGVDDAMPAIPATPGAGIPAAAPPTGDEAIAALPTPAPQADHPTIAFPIGEAAGLGPNARHQASLDRAANRTGVPAAALAAIVDAEAAKGRDGSWKTHSRNPRSSAAGLGQFLSGTWLGEAERPGTWLNATARAQGWLTGSGKVARGARSELLALRYDADASINATADYAKANLDRLRAAGVPAGTSVESIAHTAYLGHHLGVGDAIKFLKGGLDPARARTLLHAQIGAVGARQRIAHTGDPAEAHREWLSAFVERHIRPARFEQRAGGAKSGLGLSAA